MQDAVMIQPDQTISKAQWRAWLAVAWQRLKHETQHPSDLSQLCREVLNTLRKADVIWVDAHYETLCDLLACQLTQGEFDWGEWTILYRLRDKNGLFYQAFKFVSVIDHWVYMALMVGLHPVLRAYFVEHWVTTYALAPKMSLNVPILSPDPADLNWFQYVIPIDTDEALAQWLKQEGYSWGLSIDIAHFAESMDSNIMLGLLTQAGGHPKVIQILGTLFNRGAMGYLGCVTDHLWLNVYLLPVFQALAEQGWAFESTQLDHINVYSRSYKEAVLQVRFIKMLLERYGLRLNTSQTAVFQLSRPQDNVGSGAPWLVVERTPWGPKWLLPLQLKVRSWVYRHLNGMGTGWLKAYYYPKLVSPRVFQQIREFRELVQFRFFQEALWEAIVTQEEELLPTVALYMAWLINMSDREGGSWVDGDWLETHIRAAYPFLQGHTRSLAAYYIGEPEAGSYHLYHGYLKAN